eukprot:TRINITY_DN6826_c0_g1_i1.p1 TRINITY_DN6826_c0_g1~~TRINITY_DN6826_c0_g1_i1.p1  ORF type:complete len:131 (+),score=27.09 TRINITY_DN6826_c0_g1_i1:40-432(+)
MSRACLSLGRLRAPSLLPSKPLKTLFTAKPNNIRFFSSETAPVLSSSNESFKRKSSSPPEDLFQINSALNHSALLFALLMGVTSVLFCDEEKEDYDDILKQIERERQEEKLYFQQDIQASKKYLYIESMS